MYYHVNDKIISTKMIEKEVTLQSQTCENKKFILTAIIPIASDLYDFTNLKKTLALAHESAVKLIVVIDLKDNQNASSLKELLNSVCTYCVSYKVGVFQGPGNARNAAFELVKSEWVVFWDSDDIPNPSEILKSIGSNTNSEVIVGSYITTNFHTGLTKEVIKHSKNIYQVIWSPGIWRIVFRFKLITEQFSNHKMGEDQIFILKNMILNKTVHFESSVFYNYFTQVPNQLTSNQNTLIDLTKVFIECLEFSSKVDSKTKKFALLFSARQFVTIQLRCSWKYKVISWFMVLKYILGIRVLKLEKE